jgi:type III secretion protein T
MNAVDLGNRPLLELMFFGIREAAVGMMLGFTISFPFFAFRAFGAFVDAWRGATFATLIDPSTGADELVTEKLMMYAFTMFFISGPSLMFAMQALYDSFLLLPPGTMPTHSLNLWVSTLIDLFTRYISYAFVLSGPIFVGVMLVEAALSVISVYAPSLQVYSIDASVKSIFALGILAAMFEFAGDDIILLINKNIEIVGKLLALRQ